MRAVAQVVAKTPTKKFKVSHDEGGTAPNTTGGLPPDTTGHRVPPNATAGSVEHVHDGTDTPLNTIGGGLNDGHDEADKSVEIAGKELNHFLDPNKHCDKDPLLVICFDESHSLTDRIEDVPFTRFSELRRALRVLCQRPFFSIFLSTAGKFHLFSPDFLFDASNRIQYQHLDLFPPITETSFDQFAQKVSVDGTWKLGRLASTEYMASLGRPL